MYKVLRQATTVGRGYRHDYGMDLSGHISYKIEIDTATPKV